MTPMTIGIGTVTLLVSSMGFGRVSVAQQPFEQTAEQGQLQAFVHPAPSSPSTPSVSTPTPPAGVTGAPMGQPEGVPDEYDGTPLIPPDVEGAPHAVDGAGYCYVGPHPVDTRVTPGAPWDPTEGQHVRPYPPLDTRLFAFRDGCYYFTGDPRDFGYGGQTHSYYGAHPVLNTYGGGWCFMMGGHGHMWRPWSPYFTVVGPWYYWHGAYDPFFWSYWPYYSHYYRSYYPHYYGGGRFYRGGGNRVAPPIRSLPASAWRGSAGGRLTVPPVRAMPSNQMHRPTQSPAPAMRSPAGQINPDHSPSWPNTRPSFGPGPASSAPRPSFSPGPGAPGPGSLTPRPSFAPGPGSFAPRPSFAPSPRPSFSPGPGSFAPRPSFAPSPRPSFSPGPGSMGPRGSGMGSPGSFRGGGRR